MKLSPGRQLFISVLCIVVLWLMLGHLHYGSFKFKTFGHPVLWITIGVIGYKLLADKRNQKHRVKLKIAFSIYILLSVTSLFGLVFCYEGDDRVWYVSKANPSINLVCRPYECYQTSGPCNLYKSYKIIGTLRWTTEFEDAVVDTSKWRTVNED